MTDVTQYRIDTTVSGPYEDAEGSRVWIYGAKASVVVAMRGTFPEPVGEVVAQQVFSYRGYGETPAMALKTAVERAMEDYTYHVLLVENRLREAGSVGKKGSGGVEKKG